MSDLTASVIITTYNRANLVVRAVECVLEQVRPGDEIILIDDGSTDDTSEVLQPFRDRIRYFKRENSGQRASINFAFAQAKGDLVAILDDDDEWLPNKLELQRRLMEARPDILYSYTSFVRSFSDGTERKGCLVDDGPVFEGWKKETGGIPFSTLAELPSEQEDFDVFIGDDFPTLMKEDYILGALVMVRREEAGSLLHYPEDIDYCWDWEFCARLSQAGVTAYLNCDLYRWYLVSGIRRADLGIVGKATSRLKSLHRIWGEDEAFLEKYGEEFQARVDRERVKRVQAFLLEGDMRTVRTEVALIQTECPLSYRLLSRLPGPAVRAVLGARRAFNRMRA